MKAADRSFWDNFVQDFFTSASTLKIGLFNTETSERKSFGTKVTFSFFIIHIYLQISIEVNQSLIARYFHTQYMCGISSIQMTLEKAAEYIFPGDIMNVECPRVSLVHRYENGILVRHNKLYIKWRFLLFLSFRLCPRDI